ncbi:MAG: heparinase II/III family protein, partial [Planctomycetes bacterium]|nr:heparinase II/III family protein [Planctomycetota bacterium]
MTLGRTFRTAAKIPAGQLAARAKAMLLRKMYAARPEAPIAAAARAAAGSPAAEPLPLLPLSIVAPEGIDAVRVRAAAFGAGRFEYLHHAEDFSAGIRWRAEGTSPLWRYQLQYLGSVLDLALAGNRDGAAAVLASWRAEYGACWDKEAWHPYPASLRLANICHAASALGSFEALGPGTLELAATHAAYVLDHLEHDVRGNHLVENVRALIVASRFIAGPLATRCLEAALPILDAEIREQVLADGGHFEMAPMYHAIVLWRFLELRELIPGYERDARDALDAAIAGMRRFLSAIRCPDGGFPLLGDSARGFAPEPAALVGTDRIDLPAGQRSFPATGFHLFMSDDVWAIFDTGPVCPSYLPAHGQADSLTVEVWFGGRRIVGDPGVCEYTGPERAWGRSTRAHSTVSIDDRDTSEVYGSFRVGGRATIDRVMVRRERDEVTAVMTPFASGARFTRIVAFEGDERRGLRIVDDGVVPRGHVARSRLHLAPGVAVAD